MNNFSVYRLKGSLLQYRKIHIIGAPGSGKTYVATKLEALTYLTTYDLDKVFWDQSSRNYVRASEQVRTENLNHILSHDHWIVEGVYYKWLASSFNDADIIVILNPPVLIRQWRIFKRFLKRKFILGQFRKETLASFIELFWWNQKFDNNNMHQILTFILKHEAKVIFCCDYDDVISKLKINT